MNRIVFLLVLFIFPGMLCAQSARLIEGHTLLTNDCKNIRGHAGRIVAEASASTLNKDVAEAHLQEVVKYLQAMEKRLKDSKQLITPEQLKAVAPRYSSLEKTCLRLKKYSSGLQEEFANPHPDKSKIKSLATSLRNEMSSGKDVHDLLKRELGLR